MSDLTFKGVKYRLPESRALDDLERMALVFQLAREFVENREEANDSIWYCNGDKGRALLEALGIPYVEKS